MATGKVLGAANSSFSFSGGFRSIFFCCFAAPTSTGSRAKDGENFKSKEFADETLGGEGKDGADDKADTVAKDFGREEGQILAGGGGGEGVYQIRRIRNSSEQDSTVYDEFGDSAIDTGSLNSQFNIRGSVDGETMRTGDNLDLADEDVSHHENHNDDIIISERYATQGEQESNHDDDDDTQIRATTVPVFMTSVESLEVRDGDEGEGEGGDGGDGVTEADIDVATNLPVAEINVVADAGVMEDATTAAIINADRAHPPVIQCGRVRMTFSYDVGRHRLTLTIHEASDIPEHDRVNLSHSQVHLLLLPATRKIRHRTKAKIGGNPKFEETYRVKIPTDELEGNGFRLRLYRSEKFKKERMIGENYVAFSSLPFDQATAAAYSTWITLLPRININIIGSPTSDGSVDLDIDNASETIANNSPSPSAAATLSSGHSAPMELMLGLAYNATTGRLSVEVVQGCNIRSPDSQKPPDTYVKLRQIAPNGQEITRCKTTLRRSQPNPHYKETFMFHVPQFQLPDVSLMVSVFERRNIKHNQMLGWFTLGHTNSTEETKKHWIAMIESKGEQIARWQLLLNP